MNKRQNPIPRPIMATLYLLAFICLIATIYFLLGSPPLSSRMAFRKAERGNMVGPSKIIAEFSGNTIGTNAIVAETDHEYIIFRSDPSNLNYDRFYNPIKENESVYPFWTYKKDGKMILTTLPNSASGVHLILFDLEPKAVRAELESYIPYEKNDVVLTEQVTAEAMRENNHFFIFSFKPKAGNPSPLYELQRLCTNYRTDKPIVTIRLYDAQDNLIRTEKITPGPRI